ncbi:UDP-glucose/GDP-mannose dehydrogenase family protein [Candidatus Woesearchaeota archaeon]|nr:UDP-glucose/GDP-mannose dehydrogenase family protein [Candidatus Woesearchaeota archaeon]
MRITIVGTGYVGLVTGACFSDLGNEVLCLDIDEEKIRKLNQGLIPIYEPGLSDLISRNMREGRLLFTTNKQEAYSFGSIIFICVNTPSKEDGDVELGYVDKVAEDIGVYMNGYKLVVTKSTVPVGTSERISSHIKQAQRTSCDFDVVSNPEFLREGQAVKDFMNPDRIIIGVEDDNAKRVMMSLYRSLERTTRPIVITDIKSAEMIKYASNAMLATRISFMNEIAKLCEKVGADVKVVAKGMGLDNRIGPRYLQAGVGYGGSCFPKDVRGMIAMGKKQGTTMKILSSVDEVNEEQKRSLVPKLQHHLPTLQGCTIAIWGLAFKPKTDDIREAPSLIIIDQLQKLGANIIVFDPEAEQAAKKILHHVAYAKNPIGAAKDCDALLIITEWDEFRNLDLIQLKSTMKQPIIVDGRNVYDPTEMKALGFLYSGVGRGCH